MARRNTPKVRSIARSISRWILYVFTTSPGNLCKLWATREEQKAGGRLLGFDNPSVWMQLYMSRRLEVAYLSTGSATKGSGGAPFDCKLSVPRPFKSPLTPLLPGVAEGAGREEKRLNDANPCAMAGADGA